MSKAREKENRHTRVIEKSQSYEMKATILAGCSGEVSIREERETRRSSIRREDIGRKYCRSKWVIKRARLGEWKASVTC